MSKFVMWSCGWVLYLLVIVSMMWENKWSRFGIIMLASFLTMQVADGILTYRGLLALGIHVEANPLLAMLMPIFGLAWTLLGAKLVASVFGVVLFVTGSYRILFALTLFYLFAAVLPWTFILFVQ